jgi:hypothetical protein
MLKRSLVFVFSLILCYCIVTAQDRNNKITISVTGDVSKLGDTLELVYTPTQYWGQLQLKNIRQDRRNLKWSLYSDTSVYISINDAEHFSIGWFLLAEPGDSIVIDWTNSVFTFEGKGSIKSNLLKQVYQTQKEERKPDNQYYFTANSIEDYLQWDKYFNSLYAKILPLIDSKVDSISNSSYTLIRANLIADIERERHMKFRALYVLSSDTTKYKTINSHALERIFDSTCFSQPAVWARSLPLRDIVDATFISHQLLRGLGFPSLKAFSESSTSKLDAYYLMDSIGRSEYIGNARESFILNQTCRILKKNGFTRDVLDILDRYYASAANISCKSYLLNYESMLKSKLVGQPMPQFLVKDNHGVSFDQNSFKSKVVILAMLNDLNECRYSFSAMKGIRGTFEGDTNAIFLNIVSDSTSDGFFSNTDNREYDFILYPGNKKEEEILLRSYNVLQYPTVYVADGGSRIIASQEGELTPNDSLSLIDNIGYQLALLHDGPYILASEHGADIYTINGAQLKECRLKKGQVVSVSTDMYNKNFLVPIQPKLVIEPCVFEKPDKLLVLSDIEGDFKAFRKLLQANGVIDSNLNWSYGTGHLVCNGDFVDRGKQVMEVLWLIYKLEQEAKKAGGYVHFVLGNHEIMNFNGDIRYVNTKYKNSAALIKKDYSELLAKNSEIGRWLSTKNIVLKIGDVLFVHGGISDKILDLNMSLDDLNSLARNYYFKDSIARKSSNVSLRYLYDYDLSPFWYRQYYLKERQKIIAGANGIDTVYKTSEAVIDSVLSRYKINHIVTGHTIVGQGDRITTHYNCKVINTDTRHAAGLSGALLIKDNSLYEVGVDTLSVQLLYQSPSLTRK